MIPSRTSLKLYWQMVDHFAEAPEAWRLLTTAWQLGRGDGCRAIVTAGAAASRAKFTMTAQAQLANLESLERLRRHGFQFDDVLPPQTPPSVSKPVTPGTFARERRLLSEVCGRKAGLIGNAVPRSALALVETFRGRKAGDWRPLHANWERLRPIRLSGRPVTAICMFHLASVDPSGRLGLASSITLWPTVGHQGRLPAWIVRQRRRLNAQFRVAGHTAKWHRGTRGEGVMITSMREDLAGIRDVLREQHRLETVQLGDVE